VNLKPFVNDKNLWSDFLEELDMRIEVCHKRLEQVTDMTDIYQTQGEVRALKKLKQLRDKVNAQ
jgi:hypothetical protein